MSFVRGYMKFSALILLSGLPLMGCSETNSDADKKANGVAESDTPLESQVLPEAAPITEVKAKIASALSAARPDLIVTSVKVSQVTGIYEVTIGGGGTIYVSQDAEYFFLGELYQIMPDQLVNLSEAAKNGQRKALMGKINEDDLIIFSPAKEKKASIYVFTDVDCGYCRKLHQEVPEMNELGIEVKYLAYPRAGVGSKSYNKVASAWCAEDKNQALTQLKNGHSIEENICEGNPVASQFQLGGQLGVRGTPAILLESGEMIPGYIPAKELAKKLGI